MRNLEINQETAKNFKKSYAYKMGGTQTIVFPDGQSFYFDDREYYSGRGAKYNSSIRHDNLGDVIVTNQMIEEYVTLIEQRKQRIADAIKRKAEREQRIADAENKGIYFIDSEGYVELSDEESINQQFDVLRLANTLKISISDAELLRAKGKTYVFAKSEDGNTYELYHSSLYVNNLSIWVGVASPERIAEFNHQEWARAPFASQVGQTDAKNQFVC